MWRPTLFVIAVALTTSTPAGALAQNEPLAHNQTPELTASNALTGVVCPAVVPVPPPTTPPTVTSGGCRVHASGANIVLVAHVFGIESVDSTCNTEFDARLDGSAEGYLTHAELTQGTQGTCTRRQCGRVLPSDEGRPWSAYGRETAVGQRAITVLFCLWRLDNQTNTHCEVTIPFTEPTNHRYQLVANDSACHGLAGFRGELTGTWSTETQLPLPTNGEGQQEQNVEINHTSPGVHNH